MLFFQANAANIISQQSLLTGGIVEAPACQQTAGKVCPKADGTQQSKREKQTFAIHKEFPLLSIPAGNGLYILFCCVGF